MLIELVFYSRDDTTLRIDIYIYIYIYAET